MQPRADRHHALDLLRGLCALGIAIYHFLDNRKLPAPESLGTFGVYLFFVLSGLTMMLVYAPDFEQRIDRSDLIGFYRNRAARILPLLVAVSLLSFAVRLGTSSEPVSLHGAGSQLAIAFLTGSGLFGLHMPGLLSNTTGAWSLGIEAVFYLAFPVLCLGFARAPLRAVAIALAIALVSQHAIIALIAKTAQTDGWEWWRRYCLPLTFAPFFLAGIAIYRLPIRVRSTHAFLATAACLVAIVAISPLTGIEVTRSNPAYLGLTALAFAAVYFAYRSTLPRLLVGPSKALGNASYALYLGHPFLLGLTRFPGMPIALEAALYIAISLAAAGLIYRFYEAPMRRRFRQEKASAPEQLIATAP